MRPLMYRKYENYKNRGDKLPLNSPSIIKCKKCFLFFLSSMKPSHENFWQETSSSSSSNSWYILDIMISKWAYKLPKSKNMGEHVYCERRSMYRKNELFKKQFLYYKFKPCGVWWWQKFKHTRSNLQLLAVALFKYVQMTTRH